MKIATRRYGYGFRDVPKVDQGEVFECESLNPREERMIDLGYITKLRANAATFPCRECGRIFSEVSHVDRHGQRSHGKRALTPEEQDRQIEREEKLQPEIYVDRTAAARGISRRGAAR